MSSARLSTEPEERMSRRLSHSASIGGAGAFDGAVNPFAIHNKDDDDAASVGMADFFERIVIPVADEHGRPVNYPGAEDDVSLIGTEPDNEAAEAPHSVIGSGLESIKYLYSTILLIFCVTVVMSAIFTEQTTATADMGVPSVVAFFVFWFLIAWLAMMEGGQGSLVGLQPVDKTKYAQSHPRAFKTTSLAHHGDNMERFIIGRQFLVVLVVFVVNLMASSVSNASVLGMSELMSEIFLASGVAVILVTIMLGQLTAQVNATDCMLDFINNYFMLFTTYVSLAIEASGLLHAVYLVQICFSSLAGTSEKLADKPAASSEQPRSAVQKALFWARVLMSLAILAFAFAVTLTALFDGQTAMWDGVPKAVSVVIFFVLMSFVGMMEGMQIALFAVINIPNDELAKYPATFRNCQKVFSDQNLQAFLIGRQICVTICTFVIARITTITVDTTEGDSTIFGVSSGIQEFFNTGLLGAVITTVVASLAWRIIASSFPIAFLSNPFIGMIIRLCLLLEKSGLCSASWVLARYHKPIVNYQPDEVYLEGAERHTSEPVTRRDRDIDRLMTVMKFSYSIALVIFAVVVVMAAIISEKTTATADYGIPNVLAVAIFWFLIAWLAMMEGGQGALVGLQTLPKTRYEKSHVRTLRNTNLAHKGDNMERFIVGRQFLVVLVVFGINLMSSGVEGASVLGLPSVVNEIFLSTGVAVILVTIIFGQLAAQVNAANCMLDFVNNYFMLFTTYVSLALEMSGLMHSVYLVQIIFSKISGKPNGSKEAPRSGLANVFFWVRIVMSVVILGFAFAVTLAALFQGKTAMWDGVPPTVSVIAFFVLMCFVGMMDGMQIALFAVIKMPEEELKQNKVAYRNCELTLRDENLQAFLIGRQICVTICMFVVARIATVNVDTSAEGSEGETIFGVSPGTQEFFNTGLLGAVITTIVASLIWRIIASSFPVGFLSNPLIGVIIRLCLLLEASGVCSAAWVFGRFNKLLANYQPDDVHLDGAPKHGSEPITRRDKDIDVTATVLKYGYSTALLVFSIIVVMQAIFTEQTNVAETVSPLLAFFLVWFLLLWLAMMEGGQGSLVGLQPVPKALYAKSHPVTHKIASLAHKGDNMQRFIIGRQFLVFLVVFVMQLCGTAVADASVFNLSDIANEIFLTSGLAMVLMTIILGQLTAQVNAANCMLDFINSYFMLVTTYVSLAIEASGLLHAVYLVQMIFCTLAGKPVVSNEPPKSGLQKLLFWARVAMSVAILIFSFAVTLTALFQGKTTMWTNVPDVATVLLFFGLMCFVGMMEGMQIALFAVVNLPDDELSQHGRAATNCQLVFSGSNMQAFLIGRQICVTICMFLVARIATINVDTSVEGSEGETIFGVSNRIQEFFNTGLLGAVITTIVASLIWRIIASSFPVAFLSNPLINVIIRLCLLLEASGVCSAAWLLALIHKQSACYQLDIYHIGTLQERSKQQREQQRFRQLDIEQPLKDGMDMEIEIEFDDVDDSDFPIRVVTGGGDGGENESNADGTEIEVVHPPTPPR